MAPPIVWQNAPCSEDELSYITNVFKEIDLGRLLPSKIYLTLSQNGRSTFEADLVRVRGRMYDRIDGGVYKIVSVHGAIANNNKPSSHMFKARRVDKNVVELKATIY